MALEGGVNLKEKELERRKANMVRISNTEIIENLGQVNLAICDKTGTLTENKLTLRKIYTDATTLTVKQADEVAAEKSHSLSEDDRKKISTMSILEIRDFLKSDRAVYAHNLFICMAVCHTAIVAAKKNRSSASGNYICDSEDEFTLLNAVK